MRKFKFFTDIDDKEETWLAEMAKKGYELESVWFGHKFRSIKPETVTVRIDYRNFKNKEAFIDYCLLFEDAGWKHIAGTKYSGLQYFKQIKENAEDDIFSDAVSKAGKYKRFSNMWMSLAVCYLVMSVSFISGGHINVNSMLNPKLLYLTPGLWEKSGAEFWRRFLFETPFAFLRGFIWLLMPIITMIFIYSSIKARMLYNKQRKAGQTL